VREWVGFHLAGVHRVSAADCACVDVQTHLLYLAMDNSLQDCTELPTGDVSDTEIVQDYKKLSKRNQANSKVRLLLHIVVPCYPQLSVALYID
jgi:hypothetical protein